jgi:hypothetical protein
MTTESAAGPLVRPEPTCTPGPGPRNPLPSGRCCLGRLAHVYAPELWIKDHERPRCTRFSEHLENLLTRPRYLMADERGHYQLEILLAAVCEFLLHCSAGDPVTVTMVVLYSPVKDWAAQVTGQVERVLQAHLGDQDELRLGRTSKTSLRLKASVFQAFHHRELEKIQGPPTALVVHCLDFMVASDNVRNRLGALLRNPRMIGLASRSAGSSELLELTKAQDKWMEGRFG